MSSKMNDSQKKLNRVTIEILERTKYLKKQIKNNMIVGDTDIIKGITIFELIIEEINLSNMNDEIELEIKNRIDYYLINGKEKTCGINNYVLFGINNCYMILNNYNKYLNSAKYLKKNK